MVRDATELSDGRRSIQSCSEAVYVQTTVMRGEQRWLLDFLMHFNL